MLPSQILQLEPGPPIATLQARIRRRQALQDDASEATLDILQKQLLGAEKLRDDELPLTITIETEDHDAHAALLGKVKALLTA